MFAIAKCTTVMDILQACAAPALIKSAILCHDKKGYMPKESDPPMPRSRLEKTLFAAILLGCLLVGGLFAIYTPAWQTPDEPAHYNYAAQVAETGCCPIIEAGNWQSDYQRQLTTAKFAPAYLARLNTIQYEDHQPPLYYLLASAVYKLTDGSLTALRLLSVGLGAGVVSLSYLMGRRIWPHQPQIALGMMALVAFQPQHLSMMSAVNNDALGELVIALALLWLVRYLQTDEVSVWQLGLIAGVGLLSKTTTYFLVVLIPLAISLKWHSQKRPLAALIRPLAVFLLMAVGVGGLWWLRNIAIYGFPDFLGLAAHDAVTADQMRRVEYIALHGAENYLRQMLRVSFNSFWGQFGWMALPLDGVLGGWIYRGFALLTVAGLFGALLSARVRKSDADRPPRAQIQIGIVFAVTLALVLLAYLYYNLEFLQWQGRYLFPGLIPLAALLVYGLDFWRRLVLPRWDGSRWLTALALMSLSALDIYLLFAVIVPHLSP